MEEGKDPVEEEGILSLVRKALNENKLWEAPYLLDGMAQDEEILQLALNLSPSLEIPPESVLKALRRLQENALDKLSVRDKLRTSGKTVLRIKYPSTLKSKEDLPKRMELNSDEMTVEALTEKVRSILGPRKSFRLISGQRVLSGGDITYLKPGSAVMVVVVDEGHESLVALSEQRRILMRAKNDAETLKNDDRLQITDQTGKSLDLPKEERRALILAMSLHEKGRGALNQREFSLALVLLLDALQEYQNCSSSILSSVDNYGLLNLDVAWCYLNLEQIDELPQANQRLGECELNFNKTYGPDLERLKCLKGTTGNEGVLLMRLHLLQGIVAFHQGNTERFKSLFLTVKKELRSLSVSQESVEELMAQGYSESESRLALRACDGNIPHSSAHIDSNREQKARVLKEEEEERKREKKRKKLGKTADGKGYVNLGYYNTMTNMGFPENLVGLALRQCNNDMGAAIDAIQNQPDVLMLAEGENRAKKKRKSNVNDEDIAQITAMGFDNIALIKKALNKYKGNIELSIQHLMNQDNSMSSSSDDDSVAEAKEEFWKKQKEKDEAYSRMKEALGDSTNKEEDYLDSTLEEETEIYTRYSNFIKG